MEAIKDYTVHIDSKKRITLRGALYQYYNVKEYENGCIMLEPRELTVPDGISANTLKDMDRAGPDIGFPFLQFFFEVHYYGLLPLCVRIDVSEVKTFLW